MNIVYCFNDNHNLDDKEQIMLLSTSLISLFENHKNTNLDIFILYSSFNEDNLSSFRNYFSKYLDKINFIKFPEKFNENINFLMSKSVKANKWTFLRLFIWEILPKTIDKILYLDTDTIINKSLFNFYSTSEFEGKSLQVILDNNKLFSEEKEKVLGLKRNTYFNAWIFFINLKKVRKTLLKNSLEVCKNHNNLFADQDILNIAYNNSIKIIPNKYNYIVNNTYSNDVFIYHYAAMWKILKISPSLISSQYKRTFWYYFDKTIYKEYRPKIKIPHIITFIIYNILPNKLLLLLNKNSFYKKVMHNFSNFLLWIKK